MGTSRGENEQTPTFPAADSSERPPWPEAGAGSVTRAALATGRSRAHGMQRSDLMPGEHRHAACVWAIASAKSTLISIFIKIKNKLFFFNLTF